MSDIETSPALTPPPIPQAVVHGPDSMYVRVPRKIGTTFYDPSNDVNVTHEPTLVTVTEWVLDQIDAGRIEECEPPTPAAE